ncbi:hypothetical protein DV451_003867 [Geotrichum candidum]|uniref:Glycoside hydrolase family 125 protein n=1 Tax=Geotrichum candidum TaxID=1173061 RepID=A0A9P5G367_GEOCN|nr:hypothetical protein DV451_003867 [Geotrichum candidum]KAF5110064.1 hypothetical protein DV453_001046 [Geotrichum candidum]
MLPPPASSPNRNDFNVNHIIRQVRPQRQKILLGTVVLLFFYFFTNVFRSGERDQTSSVFESSFPYTFQEADRGLSKPHVAKSGKTVEDPHGLRGIKRLPKIPRKPPSVPLDDRGCPEYASYSAVRHEPYSDGPLGLAFQRPDAKCRTYKSDLVEQVIADMKELLADKDLARLFENCFPNTLDTTIRWHKSGHDPQTFIVTGDINAEWLRDSQKQIAPYLPLAKHDSKLRELFRGAINTQVDYVIAHPYCNAFHPPSQSGIQFDFNNAEDTVFPRVNLYTVFECKYEIDSLASFLALSNDYYAATGDSSFITNSWLKALARLLRTLSEQAVPTYDEEGHKQMSYYSFVRRSNTGTETLNLGGVGNPVNRNTSLIRSAFRPSDDATIYQFFIPGNAFMSVELKKTANMLKALIGKEKNLPQTTADFAQKVEELSDDIRAGILSHGVYDHPVFGKVFAYEVDGYGSVSIMDDANTPSLLSLPDMGFVEADNPVYKNTRKMILSKNGNPYYLKGEFFEGIGGPHIGTRFAWPMSHIVGIRTSTDDAEIARSLDIVKKSTADLGLMHESVNVDLPHSYTRSWFAWCNSEFARTLLYLAEHKPHLIFGKGSVPYIASDVELATHSVKEKAAAKDSSDLKEPPVVAKEKNALKQQQS